MPGVVNPLRVIRKRGMAWLDTLMYLYALGEPKGKIARLCETTDGTVAFVLSYLADEMRLPSQPRERLACDHAARHECRQPLSRAYDERRMTMQRYHEIPE